MPNWTTNRLILTGPADEIARFVSLCIRPQVGEEDEEVGFDFTALVPVPPEIEALLSGTATTEQRMAARAATGFDDWYTWRRSRWGTKWNAAHYHVITQTSDRYDFRFDTAWSCPKPIFEALAQEFPELAGFVFAIEESHEWACAGLLISGTYQKVDVEVSPELQFIVYEAPQDTDLSEKTSRSIAAVADDLCGSTTKLMSGVVPTPDSFLQHVWASICGSMSADFSARLQLRHDIQGFLEWQEGIADGYWTVEDKSEFTRLVTNSSNRVFLESCGRFDTDPDCRLMAMLSEHLIRACVRSMSQADSEALWGKLAQALAGAFDEGTLLDWAPRALLRHNAHVDMHSPRALQHSFVFYARTVFAEVETHLATQAGSAPAFQRCGNYKDMTSWDEDDPTLDNFLELMASALSQLEDAVASAIHAAAQKHSVTPGTVPNVSQ